MTSREAAVIKSLDVDRELVKHSNSALIPFLQLFSGVKIENKNNFSVHRANSPILSTSFRTSLTLEGDAFSWTYQCCERGRQTPHQLRRFPWHNRTDQVRLTLLPGNPWSASPPAFFPLPSFLAKLLSSSSSPSAHTESISPVPPSAVPTGPKSKVGAILIGATTNPSLSSSSFCDSNANFSSLATWIAARYWPYLLPKIFPPSPEEQPRHPVLGSSISVFCED